MADADVPGLGSQKPGKSHKLPAGEPDIDFFKDWPKTFGLVFAAMRRHPIVTILIFFLSTFEGDFVAPLNSGILSNTLLLIIVRRIIILTYQNLGQTIAWKNGRADVLTCLLKLGVTSIVYFVGCALLGVLLVVPGLWAMGAFALAEAILVIETASITQAFKRSRKLTGNYVVKTFLYTGLGPTILAMIVAICMGFVEGAIGVLGKDTMPHLHTVCAGLATAMIIVILLSVPVLVTRIYVRLRGVDVDQPAQ